MIKIKESKTADTRSCDFTKVSKEQLIESSKQHIDDVKKGCVFLMKLLLETGIIHDHDKLSKIDQFHSDFIGGFKSTEWYDRHRRINRHHLQEVDGVPKNVNLIDVLEMIVDCVMAGKGRNIGKFYLPKIDADVLMNAFNNTTKLLADVVEVEE